MFGFLGSGCSTGAHIMVQIVVQGHSIWTRASPRTGRFAPKESGCGSWVGF